MHENRIAKQVVEAALEVHSELGPGLLESSYQECLFYELRKNGLFIEKEKSLPLAYKNVELDCGDRIDLLVERKFIVEIKSVDQLNDVHLAQILTYLKLADIKLGLLINFNVKRLKSGIKRVINGTLE